eukprot:CAMPEP_0197037226 /NCGR_PEP_ID=MMETSP1384-20130603/14486_1 /TAXON_ID=29189 /ORGANISM="Ammonia sp." /LENGTH=1380 /DNA_ID=CAMNT_0042467497 /DNA_START=42 /DNA_END=4184 /DNA_ORIENTATION=+
MTSHQARVWQERFQSQKKLADTLQGHIYLANDLRNNKSKVVIKETYKRLVKEGKSRDGHVVHEDFHNETRILTFLSRQPDADEGFCRIIFEWETEECFYYAMQFCEAELFKFISNSFAQGGQMFQYMQRETSKPQIACDSNTAHEWLAQIQSIFRQCVQCTYWMQQKGVCHLDLSLENTMIYKVDGLKVKIIDFGLAKHFDYKNNEKDKNFLNDKRVGKRGYMAPEVYNKMVYDSRKADVWSLGVMLFMMLVGAPPYKRATQRDAAFNYIINGMLEDVLKHWRRLRLISKDALDCMEKIFKWEKDRITMEQLVAHPFVGCAHLLKNKQSDSVQDMGNSYERIKNVVKEYHDAYVLPMQSQWDKDGHDDSKMTGDESKHHDDEQEAPLIKILPDALGKTDKLILPAFANACKAVLSYGNVRLLDDFNYILVNHSKFNVRSMQQLVGGAVADSNNTESKPNEEGTSLRDLYEGLRDIIKNKSFVNVDSSIIIRRCFRNRLRCEDEKALLEVYGKYNKNVINDDEQRMAMQIMDKIYFYFAYTYNFGFAFNNDEIASLLAKDDDDMDDEDGVVDDTQIDMMMLKIKKLLKRKKQQLLKTAHGKHIYNVIRDRKVKFSTSSQNQLSSQEQKADAQQEAATQPPANDADSNESKNNQPGKPSQRVPGPLIKIFRNLKNRMQQYLIQMQTQPQTMAHRDFIKFLKTLQIRCKKEEKLASIKAIPSDQWKTLINKFDGAKMSESYFLGLSKKQFGAMLKRVLATGHIVKFYKVIHEELQVLAKIRFFTDKDRVEKLDEKEIMQLLETVLKETDKVDIENDLNLPLLRELFAKHKMTGLKLYHMDEEDIITQFIKPCLMAKFDDIDAHRFGKRYRYWPAYSDNKTNDLLNGFYTHHWYVRPKYNDIKDEILNNGICSITVNQWNRTVLYASKIIIRTIGIKKLKAEVQANRKDGGSTSNSSYNKYGVKHGDRIRLEHLVPLLIYINLDFVSKKLLFTYNDNNYINNDYATYIKYMKYHSQLSHLARLVRETVECYGVSYGGGKNAMQAARSASQTKSASSQDTDDSKADADALNDLVPPTFYHLVDKSIYPSSLNTRFFSPTSVTTSLNTAFILNDFNENEVVFELNCYPNSNLKYFNCSWLSDYPNEYEHIICGGLGCQTMVNVYDFCHSYNYRRYITAMAMLINTVSGKVVASYDAQEFALIGAALNSLMQSRIQLVTANQADNNVHKKYVDGIFEKVCNDIRYIQINMQFLLDSPLMKAAFAGKGKIAFDVLSMLFPNVARYCVTLQGVPHDQKADIIFNNVTVKFLQAVHERKESAKDDKKNTHLLRVSGLKYKCVDAQIESSDSYKAYHAKYAQAGWKLSTVTFDEVTTLSIDYSPNATKNDD